MLNYQRFKEMIDTFPGARVALVGDLMIDEYRLGSVSRINPEAPVPIFEANESSRRLGGSGNVYANLRAIGADIDVYGRVGRDDIGDQILDILQAFGGIHTLGREVAYQTPLKTRLIADNQHVLRIDHERSAPITDETADRITTTFRENVRGYDALILSDYGKGALSDSLTATLICIAQAARLVVVVDPKAINLAKYAGATIVTPNTQEALSAYRATAAPPSTDILTVGAALRERFDFPALLVTRGMEGMSLFVEREYETFPAMDQEVYDVSGAGDTVTAYLTLGLARGFSLRDAALACNLSAGYSVQRLGAIAPERDALLAYAQRILGEDQSESRIFSSIERASGTLTSLRKRGQRIGFTNGCFDLLHRGHVRYLQEIRRRVDTLIVGLNSDRSLRALKGPGRPINTQVDRAVLLAALGCVDMVIIFDEPTPKTIIEYIRPDLLAKGADYALDQIIGADFVRACGGQVAQIPLEEGYSTTRLIDRLSVA